MILLIESIEKNQRLRQISDYMKSLRFSITKLQDLKESSPSLPVNAHVHLIYLRFGSKNCLKISVKIFQVIYKLFLKIESYFVPKNIDIYHIYYVFLE